MCVNSSGANGVVNEGLNVLLVPEELFVNSELYTKLKDGDVRYLEGSNSKEAKMGVIGAKSMGVHIVGMYFLDASVSEIMELLSLLEKNLTGKSFASYAVITPETANIPSDVLRAIPVESITNSAGGVGG